VSVRVVIDLIASPMSSSRKRRLRAVATKQRLWAAAQIHQLNFARAAEDWMQFGYSAFDCSWNESGVWNAAESETNKKVEDFVDRLVQKVTDSKSGSGQPAYVKVTSMTPTPTITLTFTATPTSTPTATVAESILRAAPSVCAIIAGEGQSECSDNDVGGTGGGPEALLRVLCPTSSGVGAPPAVAPLENIHSEVYCTSSSASDVAGATLDSDSIEASSDDSGLTSNPSSNIDAALAALQEVLRHSRRLQSRLDDLELRMDDGDESHEENCEEDYEKDYEEDDDEEGYEAEDCEEDYVEDYTESDLAYRTTTEELAARVTSLQQYMAQRISQDNAGGSI